MRYLLGNSGSDGYDATECFANLWNPHGSMALRVYSVFVATSAAITGGSSIHLHRTSSIGTGGGADYVADADNDLARKAAPTSGALFIKGNMTVNPTQLTPMLAMAVVSGPVGCSVEWYFPQPIIVPAGTGLGVSGTTAGGGMSTNFQWAE